MPHIQQLSSHVADLIAAGEVVERPASVVKELLENAIDAGARAVTVEIQNGGMTYLRVTDDGCGIAPEELPTAFLRHATSKLRTAGDLAAIGTLGFRGEALAAIASVSRVDAFSRVRGTDTGASLHLEGGVPGAVSEAGCPEGTSIIVRDLFFNTPARLKFMKQDRAEASAIAGLCAHLALSHPGISFRLIRDGEEALHTGGDGVLKNAVYSALGREFALSLVPVETSDGELRVSGLATKPVFGRGTRGMQTFFVNGRLVKSQLLTAALEEAYTNRQLRGKFPGCVLNVSLPADTVDVNVHPAKTVVKFLSEKTVFQLVYHGVCDALDRADAPPAPRPVVPEPPKPGFFRSMSAGELRAQTAAQTAPRPAGIVITADGGERGGARMGLSDSAPVRPPHIDPCPDPRPAPKPPAPRAEEMQQTTLLAPQRTPWRIAGEVLDTYIVCEDEEKNVWLIDKHAAHERVNFDRLRARQEPIMAQPLLVPAVAELDDAAWSALCARMALLEEYGFECEEFGTNRMLIRAVPSELAAGEAVSALEELAGRLMKDPDAGAEGARDALLHTMACHAAIKGGWKSGENELRALVERVQSGEVRYCPHGRPVAVKLTKYELERMFKRA